MQSKNRKPTPPAEARWACVCAYREGLSIRQVAEKLGIAESVVSRIVYWAGVSRDRLYAVRNRIGPVRQTTHWRTCRQRARRLMEKHLGRKLERWEHVHHINRDYTDNRLENLEVMPNSDHSKHHHPANPTPRWLRPERQSYQKNYMESIRVKRNCVRCGREFTTTKYQKGICCSSRCYLLGRPRAQKQAS